MVARRFSDDPEREPPGLGRAASERGSRLTVADWLAECRTGLPIDTGGRTGADLVRLGRETDGTI